MNWRSKRTWEVITEETLEGAMIETANEEGEPMNTEEATCVQKK